MSADLRPLAVYLSGPMSGLPNLNREAFVAAAQRFRERGIRVVSPVEIGDSLDRSWSSIHNSGTPTAVDYLSRDLQAMAHLQCFNRAAIALLPGWEMSIGARCEVAVAISLGFAFFDATTLEPVARPDWVSVTHGYHDCPSPAAIAAGVVWSPPQPPTAHA